MDCFDLDSQNGQVLFYFGLCLYNQFMLSMKIKRSKPFSLERAIIAIRRTVYIEVGGGGKGVQTPRAPHI